MPWFFYLTVFMLGLMLSFTGGLLLMIFLGPHGKGLGRKFFSIGLTAVWRPALTVNDVGELLLKKRTYNDDLSSEQIKVGGGKRDIDDPQDRIHFCYGVPLALADEIFGVVFDQRDADVGATAGELFDNSAMYYEEVRNQQLIERVRAFFELPRGDRGVKLGAVRRIVGGWGDARAAERIIELYKKSQAPRDETTAFKQLLMPAGTFVAVLVVMWILSSIGGGGGGGGGNPVRGVNVGQTLLLLLAVPSLKWRNSQ